MVCAPVCRWDRQGLLLREERLRGVLGVVVHKHRVGIHPARQRKRSACRSPCTPPAEQTTARNSRLVCHQPAPPCGSIQVAQPRLLQHAREHAFAGPGPIGTLTLNPKASQLARRLRTRCSPCPPGWPRSSCRASGHRSAIAQGCRAAHAPGSLSSPLWGTDHTEAAQQFKQLVQDSWAAPSQLHVKLGCNYTSHCCCAPLPFC